MADVATLGIKIENGSAIVAVDQLASKLDFLGVRGESTVARLKAAFGGLAAATGLTLLGAKFLKETIDAQNAMAQLEARVKSTGGVAGLTVTQLDELSHALQDVTTYSHGAVAGAETMLLTFSKIKGDTFGRATKDVLDLAQAMGGDLQGAAIQVGKALQDPEQGLLALRRSGVSFSQAQIDLIKALFDSGKEAQAQAIILQELEKEFGGAAEAARSTLGGALKYLENQFDDLFEVSRQSSAGIVQTINDIADAMPKLGQAFNVVFTGLQAWAVEAAVAWQKFLNLFKREAGLNEALDKWKQEQLDIIYGVNQQTQAVTAAGSALDGLSKHTVDFIAETSAEIDKQKALNAAYNGSSSALAILSARMDGAIAKAKAHKEAKESEWPAIDRVIDAMTAEQVAAAKLATIKQNDADLAALRAKNDAMVQAAQDASDLADAQIAITLAERSGASAVADAQNAYDHLQVALEANAKITAAQVELKRALVGATDDETAAARQRYDETIKAIGAEKGIKDATIDRIRAANDLKSALGAIDDAMSAAFENGKVAVDKLATSLSRVFDLLSKNKNLAAGLAGLGAGYAVGQQVGGGITGAIGGAGAGAAAGAAFGPVGAIVGGLAGLTGGLLGGAAAAKARREAENQLRDALAQSTAHIKNQIGLISDLDASLADAHQQFADRAKQINDAYAGKKNEAEREALLAQNNTLEAQYIEWLKKQAQATKDATKAAEDLSRAQANQNAEQDSHLRLLNATGQSDAAFAYQQFLELQKDVADGLSGLALSEVIQAQQAEAAQREREKQTQILQDQLSTAQQAYDSLKQVYDSLSAFKSSLTIGQYSPLSARQQLDASRGQLNTLYQAALGGDQAAASQFSGAAQSFLGASQQYNASGAGYTLDFNSVSAMTNQLTSLYGQQMTDAQKQVSLLQQQLDVLKAIANSEQLQTSTTAALATNTQVIDNLSALNASLTGVGHDLESQKASQDDQYAQMIQATIGIYGADSPIVAGLVDAQRIFDTKIQQQIDATAAMSTIVATEQATLNANALALQGATDREIAAIQSGASLQQIATLDAVRQLEFQKVSQDDQYARMIQATIGIYGADSPIVAGLVDAQRIFDTKIQQQIDATDAMSTAIQIALRPLTPSIPTPVPIDPTTRPRIDSVTVSLDDSALVTEVQALRNEVAALRAVTQAGFTASIDATNAVEDATTENARETRLGLERLAS